MTVALAPRSCSIASALEVVGERWSLLVLREVFYGVHRFGEIQSRTGAPRDVLTRRLNTLVGNGVLAKHPYSERPLRFEYHVTPAGSELRPVLAFLDQWGTKWLPDAAHSESTVRHDCGAILTLLPVCAECGSVVTGRSVAVEDAPASTFPDDIPPVR